METLHFNIHILASVEKVYATMITKPTYQTWTAEFAPGSSFKGSWEEGAKILFVGPEEEGKDSGMVSRIRINTPYRFISIEHLGILKEGVEIITGPEADAFRGALEEYRFAANAGGTSLEISLDTATDYVSYFQEAFPRALKKLKEICEA
jgi:hypothetical protein